MHKLQSSVAGARGMLDLGEESRSQHPVEYEGQECSKRQGSSEQSLDLRVSMTGLSPIEVSDSAEADKLDPAAQKALLLMVCVINPHLDYSSWFPCLPSLSPPPLPSS